jgi:hypothetical protein
MLSYSAPDVISLITKDFESSCAQIGDSKERTVPRGAWFSLLCMIRKSHAKDHAIDDLQIHPCDQMATCHISLFDNRYTELDPECWNLSRKESGIALFEVTCPEVVDFT